MKIRSFYWWCSQLLVLMMGFLAGAVFMTFTLGWALTDAFSLMIQQGY